MQKHEKPRMHMQIIEVSGEKVPLFTNLPVIQLYNEALDLRSFAWNLAIRAWQHEMGGIPNAAYNGPDFEKAMSMYSTFKSASYHLVEEVPGLKSKKSYTRDRKKILSSSEKEEKARTMLKDALKDKNRYAHAAGVNPLASMGSFEIDSIEIPVYGTPSTDQLMRDALHLRRTSWNMVVRSYLQGMGLDPDYHGHDFKEAASNYDYLRYATSTLIVEGLVIFNRNLASIKDRVGEEDGKQDRIIRVMKRNLEQNALDAQAGPDTPEPGPELLPPLASPN